MRSALLALLALPAVAGPARADLVSFQTPSGNIQCLASDDAGDAFVDCEIIESDVPPPQAMPADCDLDWGTRFAVGAAGPGGMVCAGDTLRGSGYPVLGYGDAVRFGPITCRSSERGLECANAGGGGFFVARGGQRVF